FSYEGLLNVLKQPAPCRLHELKKKEYKMKKLFYRLSSRRPFARLFSMHAQQEESRLVMSCRKFFLVIVLAFAALTLGRSQEARADCAPDDWFCLFWGEPQPPDSPLISGGSKNLVYTCNQGIGTDSLILKPTPTPDQFISD